MSESKIDISELKGEGSDVVKELAEFLKEKTKAEIKTETSQMIVKSEGKTVSRVHLRMLLRKFLHQHELKNFFRIISGKENALVVKEIKIQEEEEE